MSVLRKVTGRGIGVPWWAFSPAVLWVIVVVLISVGVLGAVGRPSAIAATLTTGGCTLTPATGGGRGTDITLTAPQMTNAQTIVAAGKSAQAPVTAMAIALAAAYVDTQLSATADVGSGLGVGLFLQSSATYPGVQRSDPEAASAAFFARLLALPAYVNGEQLGAVAHAMQDTSGATQQDYQARGAWATTLAAALADGRSPTGPGTARSMNSPTGPSPTSGELVCTGGAGDNTEFDAGNIISDSVFYNSSAMTTEQIRSFLVEQGRGCADVM